MYDHELLYSLPFVFIIGLFVGLASNVFREPPVIEREPEKKGGFMPIGPELPLGVYNPRKDVDKRMSGEVDDQFNELGED